MGRFSFSDSSEINERGGAIAARMMQDAYDEPVRQAQLERLNLDNQLQRSKIEKDRILDARAAEMTRQADLQAIAANEDLFKINTEDDDAQQKLADWGAKYYRVLDQETGDPRIIRQFEINQRRAEKRMEMKSKADELRSRYELARTSGLVPKRISPEGVTFEAPESAKVEKDDWSKWGKELSTMVESFGGAANVPKEAWQTFEDRKKVLVGGAAQPRTQAPAPVVANTTQGVADGTIIVNRQTGQRQQMKGGTWQPLQ